MKPLIIGHRGNQELFIENSLDSLTSVCNIKTDFPLGIEFDVQPNKDLLPVIYHDNTLERLHNKPSKISELDEQQLLKFNIISFH